VRPANGRGQTVPIQEGTRGGPLWLWLVTDRRFDRPVPIGTSILLGTPPDRSPRDGLSTRRVVSHVLTAPYPGPMVGTSAAARFECS
jgi:hypothetical protein